ncbi:MAG: PaaI family thioesterase [Phycisphaerales bacterium]
MDTLDARIAESFGRQKLLATLGARLTRVGDGEVEIELPFSESIQQQHGFAHAGAIATIADSACGYACLTKMSEGSAVLSVEFKINLLAPAVGERLSRGRSRRGSGRRLELRRRRCLRLIVERRKRLLR